MEIIKRIEIRLAEIGMSEGEFYESSGISSALFSLWKTGRYIPSMKKLRRAASCLNTSLEYLLSGADSQEAGAKDDSPLPNDPNIKERR